MNTVEQIKALEKQKQDLLETAKAECMEVINQQVKTLAELGVYIELVERTSPKRKRRKRKTNDS